MSLLQRIFIVALFVLGFAVFANAQDIPDYLFLEVIDSQGKPVPEATVNTPSNGFSSSPWKGATDEKGTIGFYLPIDSRYDNLNSFFTVVKDGYFPYQDFGGAGGRGRSTAQIEFLKVPQNDEEKRRLGDEQLKREFMWAAKSGDVATLSKLLKKGISPNLTTTDLRGVAGRKEVPAIVFAALSADSETVKALIKAGVNIRRPEEPFRSILISYLQADPFFWHRFKTDAEQKEILNRYQDGVEILIEAGADINALSSGNKDLPIMIAANRGYTRAVKMLLDKGFSPNYMDERGTTLLMSAADFTYPEIKYSKVETVDLLLKKGADPNLSKDGCGNALSGAAAHGDIEAMQALLKAGAKANIDCPYIKSTLFSAVEGFSAIAGRQTEAAKILIEAGADTKEFNQDNENALMLAAKRGDEKMVQMLIDKGFPVNLKNANGWTALFFALTSSPKLEVVKVLLKSGADINIVAENKFNNCSMPLKFVAEAYTFQFLKLLLENGANVNLACSNGDTTLAYAITRHQPAVVKQLVESGANVHGVKVDEALIYINSLYKPGEYYRKEVDETIKIIEEVRIRQKSQTN